MVFGYFSSPRIRMDTKSGMETTKETLDSAHKQPWRFIEV